MKSGFVKALMVSLAVVFSVGVAPQVAADSDKSAMIANGKRYKLVKRVPPKFPRTAKKSDQGSVTLEYKVLTDGKVSEVSVVKSELSDVFDKAAITSVSKWRYKPNFPNGTDAGIGLKRARIQFAMN